MTPTVAVLQNGWRSKHALKVFLVVMAVIIFVAAGCGNGGDEKLTQVPVGPEVTPSVTSEASIDSTAVPTPSPSEVPEATPSLTPTATPQEVVPAVPMEVPYLLGMSSSEAVSLVEQRGLAWVMNVNRPDETVIVAQFPDPGTPITEGITVFLTTSADGSEVNVFMPPTEPPAPTVPTPDLFEGQTGECADDEVRLANDICVKADGIVTSTPESG